MPSLTSPPPYRLLLAIAVAGVAMRLLFVQWIPLQPVADFGRYLEVASSVASGGGFRFQAFPMSQPPLYPGVLGAWFMLTGVNVGAGKILNVLLWAGTLVSWVGLGCASSCARPGRLPLWQCWHSIRRWSPTAMYWVPNRCHCSLPCSACLWRSCVFRADGCCWEPCWHLPR